MKPRKQKKNRKFFNFSIKKKLILTFVFILFVPTSIIGSSAYFKAQDTIREKIQLSSTENINIINRYLTNFIVPKTDDTNHFANLFNESSFLHNNIENTMNSLQQYNLLHTESMAIYVASEKGDLLIYPDANLPSDFDPRTKGWYTQAMSRNGKAIITEPYIDEATGDIVLTVARNLQDGSGVVGIDLDLAALRDLTGGIKIGMDGYPFILSSEGLYLLHPTETLGTKADGSWVQPLLEKQNGKITTNNLEIDYITNALTGLKVAGVTNLDEVFKDSLPILKTTLFTVGIFILIGIFLTYYIVRSITRPLNQLVAATEKVCDGDLTQTITVNGNDEISLLSTSFNKMIASLQEIISQVEEKAELLAASSEQLMASSEQSNTATEQIVDAIQSVAAGTEKQSIMVKDSNSTIRGMAEQMEEIHKQSQSVRDTSLNAASIVESGNDALQLSTTQMKNIHDTISDLGKVIKTLEERSININQIIDVISDIAEQTNLLALNAAIEAARAGENGKGFAVVADEVRKLAEQSGKATEDIRQLISIIQLDTNLAVNSMDKGTSEVGKGLDFVKDAGEALMQIIHFIEHTTTEFQKVSQSINNITEEVKQVVDNVNGIEEITVKTTGETQDVSAATEEQLASMQQIAASAASLSSMAEDLQDIIKKFNQ